MGTLDASQEYVRQSFRDYYAADRLILPERFGRREWGFIPFGGGTIQRHLGFAAKKELLEFLAKRAPAHAYHSAAYYEKPGAPTMPEKGWLGADLIFDLDADHIPGAKEMGYKGMLEAVKAKFIKLLDEFIFGDLGEERTSVQLAFSGARGYHAHVRDQRILNSESHERREIVDYITATDIDEGRLLWYQTIDVQQRGRWEKVVKRGQVPPASTPGWEGRSTRELVRYLSDLAKMPLDEALAKLLTIEGVGKAKARIILEIASDPHKLEQISAGYIDAFPDVLRPLLRPMITRAGVDLGKGTTDEPVTSDIKRLIRLMGSLHGKTGLRVIPLTRDQLDDFDPLRDAVPSTYTDERVELDLPKNVQLDIKGEAFMLAQGTVSVPQYVAIFMICRGMATLAPGPAHELIRRQDHHQPQVRQGA